MVRVERTGKRDLTYNYWHRKLPNNCYMINLDSIEWRDKRGIVAIIETAPHTNLSFIFSRKRFEIQVYSELAKKLNVPFYLVLFEADKHFKAGDAIPDYSKVIIKKFHVYQIEFGKPFKKTIMTESEYIDFIKNIGVQIEKSGCNNN